MPDHIRAALIQLAIRRHDTNLALQQLEALERKAERLERLEGWLQAGGSLTCTQLLKQWRRCPD